ncbi:hypothetical protein ACWJJH_00515 [Endozoicomonadaceae bacterium StTr2]
MYPRFFTASRLLAGSLLVSFGLLTGCASQQPVQSELSGSAQPETVQSNNSANQRMLLPLQNNTPEQLARSVISFLNGQNTSAIQSVIKDDAFIRITSDAPVEIRNRLQAPNFINQLMTAIANEPLDGDWYLNRCRVSFDTVYAQCSLLNSDWSWGPLELDIALTVNGYMIKDMTNFNASSSASALANSLVSLYYKLERADAATANRTQRLLAAVKQGNPEQVKRQYYALPVRFQKNHFLQVIMLSHVSADDPVEYLDALEPFALNKYSHDNMALQVDYYYMQQGRNAQNKAYMALKALDKLDKRIGASDYSRYQRAEVNYALQRYPETLQQAIPLIRNQPNVTEGYWLALLSLVSMEDHQQAAELVTLMIDEFGYEFTRANLESALSEGNADHIDTFMASAALKTVKL